MSPAPGGDFNSERMRRSLAAGALGAAALLSARAFLKPDAKRVRKLLDWAAVRRLAVERSGGQAGRIPAARRAKLSEDYAAMAAELAPLLSEVCNDTPFEVPAFVALDRPGFIDANITIAQRILDPIERLRATLPESAATAFGRRIMDRYVGELFGLMARRVLGQYDPVLSLDPRDHISGGPKLYLVEPNLVAVERGQQLDSDALRRWIILHELSHAWQFGQHPWLAEHIASMMRSMVVDSVSADGTSLLNSRDLLQRLPETLRAQLRGVSKMQSLMSVLEGYSNFVMHRVGEQHIPDAKELQAALQRRRQQRTAIERLVFTITGLEFKMRQYEVGERFCVAVADKAGLDVLNRVWESAAMMPTSQELKEPARWLARVA